FRGPVPFFSGRSGNVLSGSLSPGYPSCTQSRSCRTGCGVECRAPSTPPSRGENHFMTVELATREPRTIAWTQRHLLGLEDLSRVDLKTVLDRAEEFVELSQRRRKKRTDLAGKVVVNLFFEPSTRTRTSFGLAARRLSADTLDFSPGGSSVSKGETF